MLRRRCGRLLAQLERARQLLELDGRLEEDFIRVVRSFEATRQRCCWLEKDRQRAHEQLARAEAERVALEVKLKHARNQVEVEMKKRHRAEAELEKQERRLQLVLELLMQEPWGNEEQCSVLSTLAGWRLGTALAAGRRSSAVDESCQSLLSHSDISYDRTEDDVDIDVMVVRALKRKAQERQRLSLAPQVGPVVVAKRHRSSVAPSSTESIPPAPRPAEVLESARSPPPPVLVPRRCSRQGHRISTHAELTTVWGTSDDRGGCASAQESQAEGSSVGQPAPGPSRSPPPDLPSPRHHFSSKMVIRPEPCGACSSRLCFGRAALRCRQCQLLLHPKCRERCPGPCTARPRPQPRPREGVLADFAPPTAPLVPALVVQCVTEVETRGLAEAGLYRVPGAEPLVREWKRRLLHGGETPSGVADIHVVCGVLKDFLRSLKEPLVTFGLHPAFLRAADIPDETACGTALRHVVGKLPAANRDTLAFLMLHLLRVSRSPDCKMDVLNLSRVFGPTLVGHSSANPTPLTIMEDTPRQCKVVARLLALPSDFWKGFVGTEENPVPTPDPSNKHGRGQPLGKWGGSSPLQCSCSSLGMELAPEYREGRERGGQRGPVVLSFPVALGGTGMMPHTGLGGWFVLNVCSKTGLGVSGICSRRAPGCVDRIGLGLRAQWARAALKALCTAVPSILFL
ncbi:rac GTPase-activating protein 1-like isoform X2 [Phasianus colchicus]|uniref:rac GTPase-activating protein 1-like isoform X2 n=1 Tax=Phasianus colchicus TaxID=9054 RepID=UPI00129E5547|nr:rac GTPase-activating protein 1-like isoform X2 [Phasianus colchicus]